MTDKELMNYFDFDESDLNANRNGSLSSRQSACLRQKDQSVRKAFLIVGWISAILVVLPTLILWLIGSLSSVGWYSLLWIIPCGLLAVLLIRAGSKSTIYVLRKVEGPIEVIRGGSYQDPTEIYYELRIGDKGFGIGQKLASRLREEKGAIYIVYYYWGSDTVETDLMDSYIMSLERVSAK